MTITPMGLRLDQCRLSMDSAHVLAGDYPRKLAMLPPAAGFKRPPAQSVSLDATRRGARCARPNGSVTASCSESDPPRDRHVSDSCWRCASTTRECPDPAAI